MKDSQLWAKLILISCLYVAQYLPIGFFSFTLPTVLRNFGFSLEAIGLTSLVTVPTILKILWAPVVDRYGWTRWGHYKTWIIAMQSLLVLALLFTASLDLNTQFPAVIITMVFICCCAATQDIAIDAMSVQFLQPTERGAGNAAQRVGSYLGSILGGGGFLILVDQWGWSRSLPFMAFMVLLLMIPVLLHKEQHTPDHYPTRISYRQAMIGFFRQRGIIRWLLALLVYMTGSSLAMVMLRPLMVDLGLSLSQIGLLLGIVSLSAGMVGAIIAGVLIKPLGRRQSLILFGILQVIGTAPLILLTLGFTSLPVLYIVCIGLAICNSLPFTILFTLMMDYCRPETAGTDYTLQSTIVVLGIFPVAGISGFITQAVGYTNFFAICVGICLMALAIVGKGFKPTISDTGLHDEKQFPMG